jgi:hypothetical protein
VLIDSAVSAQAIVFDRGLRRCSETHFLRCAWRLKGLFERSWRYANIHELCHSIFVNHSSEIFFASLSK